MRHVVPTTVVTRVVDVVDPAPSVAATARAEDAGSGVPEGPTASGTPSTAPAPTAPPAASEQDSTGEPSRTSAAGTIPRPTVTSAPATTARTEPEDPEGEHEAERETENRRSGAEDERATEDD